MKTAKIEVDFIGSSGLDEVLQGQQVQVSPDGSAGIAVSDQARARGFGVGEITSFTLEILGHMAKDMTYAFAAAWLYERFFNRARTITFQGRPYRIITDDLEKLLERIAEAPEAPGTEPQTPP